jgi:hypothetical protein
LQPAITLIADAIETTNPEPWIVDRLMVQADEIALRQEGWFQGTADLDYVRTTIGYLDAETLDQMLLTLEQIKRLDVGDPETKEHRDELIQAIQAARATVQDQNDAAASETVALPSSDEPSDEGQQGDQTQAGNE